MKTSQRTFWISFIAVTICFAFAISVSAQVQTQTSTHTTGTGHTTKVENGEVVHVSGNNLVVKMADGTIRDFPNVPDSVKITVDGKELSVHDLKPGMKLQRTITTTSTSRIVKTTQSVTGKVWQVTPPNSVILRLEDGTNEQFQIPPGQKFNINGQETDAFGLKKGMSITATKVVEVPETTFAQQAKVTGEMPPTPAAPPADLPILVVVAVPAPAPSPSVAAAPAPTKLPQTGSELPLIGFIGMLSIASSLGLKAFRSKSGK
jgi:LPXTG-motif cell wall-anchored protein